MSGIARESECNMSDEMFEFDEVASMCLLRVFVKWYEDGQDEAPVTPDEAADWFLAVTLPSSLLMPSDAA